MYREIDQGKTLKEPLNFKTIIETVYAIDVRGIIFW